MEIQEDDRPRRVPPSASPHFDRASTNTNTHTNLNLNLSPHPRPTVQHRSLAPARAGSDDSFDLDDDLELDEATLAVLDKAEKDVNATLVKSSQTQVARSQTQRLTQTVINIDSDEDEDMDKENAAPMRAAKKGRGGGVFGSQNVTVVDISDSE
ncbi:hypothetical protein DL96DRAFT_1291087 [Flagelloscypha sp. PMI_526]|nr:hypothetical protein DL96DRAFT_1291087 [Flagelloscypha sp. PMI_526]